MQNNKKYKVATQLKSHLVKPLLNLSYAAIIALTSPTYAQTTPADDDMLVYLPAILAGINRPENGVYNGWYVTKDKEAIWGYIAHNGWWGTEARPNITRNAYGQSGPLKTVDFELLTDAMLNYGYPGFEHNYGLWYDRRRDAHDTKCRTDSNVQGPVLEQPWARSNIGYACDGKNKYDLENYNQYYFDRLADFAEVAQRKGVVFINNFYMQHALVGIDAHYADSPWRPRNNINNLPLPDHNPAANYFYNNANPAIRHLHEKYINKVLDTLGGYQNVVHFVSHQFTGDVNFVRFWIDTVKAWERTNNKQVHIGLGATKDVQDNILSDTNRSKDIQTIDLEYWWYKSNGTLFAPPSGQNVDARYSSGFESAQTSPEQIYRQIREYRDSYPKKALVHKIAADRRQTWAVLMAGGSMLIRYLNYSTETEQNYVAPVETAVIQNSYNFINQRLKSALPKMKPENLYSNQSNTTWCLSDRKNEFLYYLPYGGQFKADLHNTHGSYNLDWFNPRTGATIHIGTITGGGHPTFTAPDNNDWALLIEHS